MIVDRVFQPIADRLAGRVSPFDLARQALVGLVVMRSAAGATDWTETPGREAVGVVLVLVMVGLTLRDVKRAENAPLGTLNPLRSKRRFERAVAWTVLLTITAQIALRAAFVGVPAVGYVFILLAALCWVAAEGFMACERRPPKRQDAKLPAWMAGARSGA